MQIIIHDHLGLISKSVKIKKPGVGRFYEIVNELELISKLEKEYLAIHFIIYLTNIFEYLSLSSRGICYILYLDLCLLNWKFTV